jgi:hypothetical protein
MSDVNLRKLKVYGASKIEAWEYWLALRDTFKGIEWTAAWPEVIRQRSGVNLSGADKDFSAACWLRDFQDIQAADALILLAPAKENHLRGGLVEAGYALGLGKPVYLVGDHADFGSWQYHPMVRKFEKMEDCLDHLENGVFGGIRCCQ